MARILVVDDDGHIRDVVRFALEQVGHLVDEAAGGTEALTRFDDGATELVVLDVMMPDMDGLSVCRALRERGAAAPILFLSSRDEEIDRVLGLELGGDDYLGKPFSPRELVARVKAILRRTGAAATAAPATDEIERRHGPLELDLARHRCHWGDAEIQLTATEFTLLEVLLRHPGRVYARQELVERGWGYDHHITDRTVDSHVRRIRQKFAAVGGDPVETVYGVGYRLREELGAA